MKSQLFVFLALVALSMAAPQNAAELNLEEEEPVVSVRFGYCIISIFSITTFLYLASLRFYI